MSVFAGLLVLLVRIAGWLEQTQSAEAVVKMLLPKLWWNFDVWKAEPIRLPRTFSLDHPEREL